MNQLKDNKTRFFLKWTLWSAFLIPGGAGLGLLAAITFSDFFANSYYGEDLPRSFEIANYWISMSILGTVISLAQWLLLRRNIRLSPLWILACIGGFIMGESIAGVILWKLEIGRADLGWAQGGSILAEALIFLFSGALIGFFQYPLLKKVYHKAELWIVVSAIAWALVPLTIFIFGGLILGAITGAALIWILRLKKE